jgi:hypothetical protein
VRGEVCAKHISALITGVLVNSKTANLWVSAATFRRDTAEKVSFILLNQFDLILTVVAVYFGFSELNPLMRFVVNIPVLLLVIKIALPLLIAWLVPGKLLWPSIALYAFIIIWNVKELLLLLL